MHKGRLIGLLILLSLLALTTAQAARYTASDLGTLGGNESWALGVNKNGAVVGCSIDKEGRRHPFLWTQEAGMTDLGTLGGSTAVAVGISDVGEIVGYSEVTDGGWHTFLVTVEGSMVDLGALPGDSASEATAVSDLVVGTSKSPTGAKHAFSWSVDTNMIALGPLVPDGDCFAADVNESNVVVGTALDANGARRAVVWSPEGVIKDIGTLGGPSSSAYAISDSGWVVGKATDEAGRSRPFCWFPDSGMRPLPVPRGAADVFPNAISDANQVVGSVTGTRSRAVAWDLGNDPAKRLSANVAVLPLLRGTVESEAEAVGGSGIVVGCCKTANGERHATIWRPVETKRNRISIALVGGAFVPTAAATRDKFDNTWWRVALKPFERTKQTGIHLIGEGGAFRLTGDTTAKLYSLGFGVERGFPPGFFAQSYLALRAGPYWGRQENQLTGATDSTVGLNINAAYGVIFFKSMYGELRYDYFTKFAGIDFSGFSVSIGFRLFDLPW